MDKINVTDKLTKVFKSVFENDNLVLTDEMTASDVDNWDSLTHMILVSEIEKDFEVKFKLKDLNKMKNVGNLVEVLISKLN